MRPDRAKVCLFAINRRSITGVFHKSLSRLDVFVFGNRHAIAGHEIKVISAYLADVIEIYDKASVRTVEAVLRKHLESRDERAAAGDHAALTVEVKLCTENFNI